MSASTRPRASHGGFGSRPAKNMLYSRSSLRSSASRSRMSCSKSLISGTGTQDRAASASQQKPHQRKPELPGVRQGTIVDEHLGLVETSDQHPELVELGDIAHQETGTVEDPDLPVLGRSPRHLHRAL